jgi:hypothetical protein
MALPLVLFLGILVSLVIMLHGRVVVLVLMHRHDGSFRTRSVQDPCRHDGETPFRVVR